MQMFDDFDHDGDHGGDHDGDHDDGHDVDHGGDHGGGHDDGHDGDHGGGVDDDVALVARRPKQQCGSDDSSSTSGLPESHFPPFSSTMDLLTFSSVCFSHFVPLYSGEKDYYTGFTCRISSKRILIVSK